MYVGKNDEVYLASFPSIARLIPSFLCNNGYYGDDCQYFDCYGKSFNDSSVCSSRGKCIDNSTCQCDNGYYGEMCQYYNCYGIASNSSAVCSGHGLCAAADSCTCNNEYYGSNCSQFDCFGINPLNSTVCSSHGSCKSLNNCTCEDGYYGNDCSQFTCFGIDNSNSSVCSSHGVCSSLNNCTCSKGYNGDDCSQFSAICFGIGYLNESVCNGNGHCVSLNKCECDNDYYGFDCGLFNCQGKIYNDSSVCSSHGSCQSPDNCSCVAGYYGSDCACHDCFGIERSNSSVCSSHGLCESANKCKCDIGYYGIECSQFNCYGVSSLNSSTCSSHGFCISSNNCTCEDGYYGNDCSQFTCFGIENSNSSACSSNGVCSSLNNCTCSKGYNGDDCSHIPSSCFGISPQNESVCNGNGQCTSLNKCECDNDYYGFDCGLFNCQGKIYNDSSVCSSHGSCQSPDNCSCFNGYYDNDCSNYACFGIGKSNSSVCSSHGSCESPNKCKCEDGYSGDGCSQFKCYGVDNMNSSVCSSHGQCISPNNCKCLNGYYGSSCEIAQCFGKFSNDSNVCSGNGQCAKPDSCGCKKGYEGENCQYHTCFGKIYNDSSVCSGNGICKQVDLCECSSKSNNLKISGSNCEIISCLGPNNQFYLQSDSNACSGNGICSAIYGGCNCSSGYSGDACQYFTCNGISANNSNVCNGKGSCIDRDKCKCQQSESIGYWTGNNCEKCSSNYQSELTGCKTRSCDDSTTCNSHGVCNSSLLCECKGNWDGVSCLDCKQNYFGANCERFCEKTRNCSGHGSCSVDGYCVCDSNSNLGYFEGNSCQKCQNGYFGNECLTQIVGPVKFLNMFNGIKFKLFAPKSYSLNNVNCSNLVKFNSNKLGSDPICSWIDKQNGDFQILFGQDFTLTIGYSIGLDRNVFNSPQSISSDLQYETCLNADNPVTPTAKMNAKTTISSCENIIIDASGSFSGDRIPLIYHWSVQSSPITLPQLSSMNTDKLELNATESGLYVFRLQVESSISGRISEAVDISITKLSIPLPSVSILPISTILTSNSVPLLLKKIITLPDCYFSDQSMKVDWKQVDGPVVESQIDSNNNLMIKKFTTVGDQSYTFNVTVTSMVNSKSTSTALVSFKTQFSPMELSIYPSDISKTLATLTVEFNDPDNSGEVETWNWTCQDVTNNSTCGSTISQLLSITKSCQTLDLPSTDFKLNSNNPLLRISLTITKGLRFITSFTDITFPSGQILLPTISLIKYSPTNSKILKTDTFSLDLDVTVNGEKFGYETFITREWKLNGKLLSLSNPLLDKMSELLNSIVINPSSLDEGSTYTISLTITDNRINQYSTYSQQFTIATSPQPCLCTLSPSSGIALETIFTYSCVNCQNEQKSLQLSYGFGKDTSNMTLFTGTTSYSTKLPLTTREYVKITDTLTGAFTFVSVSATIKAATIKSITEAKKKLSTYNIYEKSLKDGDPNKLVFNTATISAVFDVMMAMVTRRRNLNTNSCVHGVFDEISKKCKCQDGYAKKDCSITMELFKELAELRVEMMNNTIDQFNARNLDELMTKDFLIFEMMIIDSMFTKYDEIDTYIISNGLEIVDKVIELSLMNKNLKVETNFDSLLINIINSVRKFLEYNNQELSFNIDKLIRNSIVLILRRNYVGEKNLLLETDYSTIISNKIYRNKYSGLATTHSNSSIILPSSMPQYLSETSNRKPLSFYMSSSSYSDNELNSTSHFIKGDEKMKNETIITISHKSKSEIIGFFGIDVNFQNIIDPIAFKLQLNEKMNKTSRTIIEYETKSLSKSISTRIISNSSLYCATPFNSSTLLKDESCNLIMEDNSDIATCMCTQQRIYLIMEERIVRMETVEILLDSNNNNQQVPPTSNSTIIPTQLRNYDYLAAIIIPFVILFICIVVAILICLIVGIRKKSGTNKQLDSKSIELATV